MAVGGAPVTPVGKDGTVLGRPASYTPRGYRQFTSADLATAVGFADIAGGVPEGATTAIIENNGTQAVRWRDDGIDPTASVGNRVAAGGVLGYDGDFSAIKFIRESAGALLDVWTGS